VLFIGTSKWKKLYGLFLIFTFVCCTYVISCLQQLCNFYPNHVTLGFLGKDLLDHNQMVYATKWSKAPDWELWSKVVPSILSHSIKFASPDWKKLRSHPLSQYQQSAVTKGLILRLWQNSYERGDLAPTSGCNSLIMTLLAV